MTPTPEEPEDRSLSALFDPLRRAEPPPELWTRVQARARALDDRRARPSPWLLRCAAAAAGMLLVLGLARSAPRTVAPEGARPAELHALRRLVAADAALAELPGLAPLPEQLLLAHFRPSESAR